MHEGDRHAALAHRRGDDKITQGNLDDTVGTVCENEVKGIMKSLKAIK